MPNPDQSLDQVLAELEAEYAALGDKIAFVRERLGLEPGQGDTGPLQSYSSIPKHITTKTYVLKNDKT